VERKGNGRGVLWGKGNLFVHDKKNDHRKVDAGERDLLNGDGDGSNRDSNRKD